MYIIIVDVPFIRVRMTLFCTETDILNIDFFHYDHEFTLKELQLLHVHAIFLDVTKISK